jgi:hypothetical protein
MLLELGLGYIVRVKKFCILVKVRVRVRRLAFV